MSQAYEQLGEDGSQLKVIGKPVARIDGVEKVTGAAIYAYDMEVARMLFGKIHRSRYPHAVIISVDIEKALRVPGVRAIITAKDTPGGLRGRGLLDTPILASDKARYVGDPIAAVAAENLEAAEEAVDLIEVEYGPLPAIYDPEESMKSNPKVVIHPDVLKYRRLKAQIYKSIQDPTRPNVANYYRVRKGDVDAAFREAEVVIENRFTTHMVQHAHIEPNVVIAKCEAGGGYTLWTSGQNTFRTRRELSDALKVPETKIRVIALRHVGGGFGNKGAGHIEPIVACLAKQTGRPVKISLTREEVFSTTSVRHPSVVYIKDGLKRDGTIVAREMKVIYNGGAYSLAGNVVNKNAIHAISPVYRLPNLKCDIYRVYTNQVQGGAFRGFGAPQVYFAVESQMDIDAQRLGIDPIEFRRRNLLKEGEKSAIGERLTNITIEQCIARAVEAVASHPMPKREGKWRYGTGFAVTKEQCDVSFASAAYVKLLEDGAMELWTAATDPGEGIHTVLAQIVAEGMQVPIQTVRTVVSDTDLTPVGTGASGSRQTSQMGMAVKLACDDLRRKMVAAASQRWGIREDSFSFRGGKLVVPGEGRTIEYSELFSPGPMGGAYSLAGNVVNKNAIHAISPVYRLPNLKCDIYRVYTNQVQGGAFRGF
ncbi:MAG: xanthine dehydrogenase family protein molybdopterin-binding subunit, partial [Thaumarchaeota archaeon]|nr:xanthine dehydrogenase family protein molybdopterin-binding subunit [Nitrososphaerota archaeon]